MKLTQKQKLFADYYLKTGNAEESAKRAGYSARGNTTKLLQNTTICSYLKKRNDKIDADNIASMKEVKEKVSAILRGEIEGVEIKDILKAADFFAKTNGAFLDKVEVTEKHIVVDIEEDDEE